MIKSYTEPFNRRDPILLPTDVARAIEYFNGFGTLKKLYLNPKYVNPKYKTFLKADYPEDVEVEEHPGCGAWEIRGEIKEGTKIPEDKNTGGQTLPSTADKLQDNKDVTTAPLTSPDDQAEAKEPLKTHSRASLRVKRIMKQPKRVIMKQKRGRPVKVGEVSRSTLWRRAKQYPAQKEKLL